MPAPMTLHFSPRSPYVRKVMIVAHETSLTDRLRTVRTVVGGTTPNRELMRQNPLGKIPTLVLEDGTVIYDSPVICEYLDTLHDGPKLYPSWPERLTALRRLAFGDGILDTALAWLVSGSARPSGSRQRISISGVQKSWLRWTRWRTKPMRSRHHLSASAISRLASRWVTWTSGSPRSPGASSARG
jgi:glutathione S-transferase